MPAAPPQTNARSSTAPRRAVLAERHEAAVGLDAPDRALVDRRELGRLARLAVVAAAAVPQTRARRGPSRRLGREPRARGLVQVFRRELDAVAFLHLADPHPDGRADRVVRADLGRVVVAAVPGELGDVAHAVGPAVERDEDAVALDALHDAVVHLRARSNSRRRKTVLDDVRGVGTCWHLDGRSKRQHIRVRSGFAPSPCPASCRTGGSPTGPWPATRRTRPSSGRRPPSTARPCRPP